MLHVFLCFMWYDDGMFGHVLVKWVRKVGIKTSVGTRATRSQARIPFQKITRRFNIFPKNPHSNSQKNLGKMRGFPASALGLGENIS